MKRSNVPHPSVSYGTDHSHGDEILRNAEHVWLRESLGLAEDQSPFPWQQELLERFANGLIERFIDIPTGLGKTAVIAIWLIARALGAKLPRRLVYVVDRRAVVDQATDVAKGLREYVDDNSDLKRALRLGDRSLPISTLRGQHVDNREWLADPSSPAIIVGTVDMVGSRLLFEGYGVSRKMRPYHAGLLGSDTLVVLDESHLVPPFEKLLESIADGARQFGPRDETRQGLIPPFHLLSLSATGRTSSRQPFGLTGKDFKHPVVSRRLTARKQISLFHMSEEDKLPIVLAREAWKLADAGSRAVRVIVFCDKRKDAEATKAEIERLAKGDAQTGTPTVEVDTDLFVGGRRVFERERAAQRLKGLGFLAGSTVETTRPAFVIATSAGEVGVDLDADHMVCDLVAWERMVQRLGRVNRRGDGDASVVVVAKTEKRPDQAIKKAPEKRSKSEAEAVSNYEKYVARMSALKLLPADGSGYDGSPRAIARLRSRGEEEAVLLERLHSEYKDTPVLQMIQIATGYVPDVRKALHAATTPTPLRPALSRAVVDAWSLTSLKYHTGRPEIGPWLRGWIEHDPPRTSVVWRTHLPARAHGRVAKKEIEAFFEAAPPHASETLETETSSVVDWLTKRAKTVRKRGHDRASADEEMGLRDHDVVAIALSPAGDYRTRLTLQSLDVSGEDKKELHRTLAGATLVVDVRLAGLKDGLLDSTQNTLPRTVDDGGDWLPLLDGEPMVRFRVRRMNADDDSSPPDGRMWRLRYRFVTSATEDGEASSWLVVEKWKGDSSTEDDRAVGRIQLLKEHQELAERRAHELVKRLALPERYEELVDKVLPMAARLHDEGKRSRRWQQAFNAPADGQYAKTLGPVNVALLDGYRHEFGSLQIAANDGEFRKLPSDLQDLVLHLIAAHHGFARPVIGITGCEDAPPSALEGRARDVALRFARLQRQWGPWGLAWWESLLRAVDQQASRENEASHNPLDPRSRTDG